MMKKDWCYSFNGENYSGSFETKEDAIAEAIAENETNETIWVGQAIAPTISVSPDHLIDEVYEDVRDQCGEYADGFLEHIDDKARKALEERVNAVFNTWLKEFEYEPTFYTVTNTEEIKTTA